MLEEQVRHLKIENRRLKQELDENNKNVEDLNRLVAAVWAYVALHYGNNGVFRMPKINVKDMLEKYTSRLHIEQDSGDIIIMVKERGDEH